MGRGGGVTGSGGGSIVGTIGGSIGAGGGTSICIPASSRITIGRVISEVPKLGVETVAASRSPGFRSLKISSR